MRLVKHSPLVEEMELTDVNPTYAHIRYPDAHESTVALKHLAPCPSVDKGSNRVTKHTASDTDPSRSADKTPPQLLKDAVASATPTAPPSEARNDRDMPEASGPETLRRLTRSNNSVPPLIYVYV